MNNKFNRIKEDYKNLLPDLGELECFDLNWDNSFDCCQMSPFSNFGVVPIYCINGRGHDYLVMCPMPNKSIEEYPIAIYDEEGSSEVIASSIKTWLPCLIVKILADEYMSYGIHEFTGEENKVIELAERFSNNLFSEKLSKILFQTEKREPTIEEIYRFYQIADPNSFISDFYKLKERHHEFPELKDWNTEFPEWKEFIFQYPVFNQCLFQLIKETKFKNISEIHIDADTAYEVFNRRINHDYDLFRISISDVMCLSAKIVYNDHRYKNKPFWNLIKNIVEEPRKFWYHVNSDIYNEQGKLFEENNQLIDALTCYENSIFFKESFDITAFENIKAVAKKIGNSNYLAYLKSIEEGKVAQFL
jgi:hypothetical protein